MLSHVLRSMIAFPDNPAREAGPADRFGAPFSLKVQLEIGKALVSLVPLQRRVAALKREVEMLEALQHSGLGGDEESAAFE